MQCQPVTVAIHAAVNGRMGSPLARIELPDPESANARVVKVLRDLADTMENMPELFDESMAVTP